MDHPLHFSICSRIDRSIPARILRNGQAKWKTKVGRSRAVAKRRDGSRTGSVQEEIGQRNGQVHSALGQTFSPQERNDALFGHLDDDLLCKSRRLQTFSQAKAYHQSGPERVSQVSWAKVKPC